jgi:hypothetical protein
MGNAIVRIRDRFHDYSILHQQLASYFKQRSESSLTYSTQALNRKRLSQQKVFAICGSLRNRAQPTLPKAHGFGSQATLFNLT